MDKICFICDTPIQLLNGVILWHYMKQDRPNVIADIYMGNMYNSCRNISEILKQSHMFNEVFFYNLWSENHPDLTKGTIREKLNDLLFPEVSMRNMLQRDIPKNEYSEIYFGCYGRLVYLMILFNPDAELNGFEEGIGTYTITVKDRNKSYRLKRLRRKIEGKPSLNIVPAHIYFHYPSLFSALHKDTPIIPKQMPILRPEDTEITKFLLRLLDFQRNRLYDERRLVYLTQPYYEAATSKGPETEIPILKTLEEFRDDIVLKVHYRQQATSYYHAFDGDWRGEFWELVSLVQINDNHILLSPFSTAQLTPKLMFDKEPWLVFIAPLWEKQNQLTTRESKVIDVMRQIYRSPEKVIVVRDVPELSMRLEQILRKGEKKYD